LCCGGRGVSGKFHPDNRPVQEGRMSFVVRVFSEVSRSRFWRGNARGREEVDGVWGRTFPDLKGGAGMDWYYVENGVRSVRWAEAAFRDLVGRGRDQGGTLGGCQDMRLGAVPGGSGAFPMASPFVLRTRDDHHGARRVVPDGKWGARSRLFPNCGVCFLGLSCGFRAWVDLSGVPDGRFGLLRHLSGHIPVSSMVGSGFGFWRRFWMGSCCFLCRFFRVSVAC
jgi:hypothetical protein